MQPAHLCCTQQRQKLHKVSVRQVVQQSAHQKQLTPLQFFQRTNLLERLKCSEQREKGKQFNAHDKKESRGTLTTYCSIPEHFSVPFRQLITLCSSFMWPWVRDYVIHFFTKQRPGVSFSSNFSSVTNSQCKGYLNGAQRRTQQDFLRL